MCLDRRKASVAAVVAASLACSVHARIPCEYEITAIIRGPYCPLISGYSPTRARGLNEYGHVVGYYTTCALGPDEAYLWTPQTGPVTLERPSGYTSAAALDINDTGVIVGSLGVTGTDGPYAAVWQDGGVTDLGTLPGGDFSQGRAINSRGHVVGHWGNENTGPIHGFVWQDGVMVDLGRDLGTVSSRANDISDAGQVVGWMGSGFMIDGQAFVWEAGLVTSLGHIPGGFFSIAAGINNRSEVAGWGLVEAAGFPIGQTHGFLSQGGKMIDLAPLPGFNLSGASDINDAGLLVGHSWDPGSSGFVWQDGRMIDLNDLIPQDGGVHVKNAHAINNQGQIACAGSDQNGDLVGLLLTPVESPLGDLTCDGFVLLDDLRILLESWGTCPPEGDCAADLDGDDAVGITDLLILLGNWG